MKTVERKSDHHVLRSYMARIAGRSVSRFCSPRLIDLRFAVHANAEETLKIIAELERNGEIIPEVRNIGGKEVSGWIVYPATNKSVAPRTVIGRATYTPADCAFLAACGISAVADDTSANPTKTAGAVPPVNKSGATACAAAL